MMRVDGLMAVVAGLSLLLVASAGCQRTEKQVEIVRPPANAKGEQLVDPKQFELNRPAEDGVVTPDPQALPPEPPNPMPTGDTWVYTPRLTNYIGQNLEIRYKLPDVNAKAWIAFAPVEITATDVVSNQAGDVAMAATVPAAEATVNIDLDKPGKYRLRLFDGQDAGAKLLAESPVVTVQQWPLGDREAKRPPYVTIGQRTNTDGPIEIQQGYPAIAYYEVPPGYPPSAWIGVIPTRVLSPRSDANDGADVHFGKLEGAKGQSTWMTDQQGTFVFRVFPSDLPGADYVAESEPFTIVPRK